MKLLQKTIRQYFLLSFFVLLIAIPIFYFLLEALVKEEIDEELVVDKHEIIARLKTSVLSDDTTTITRYLDNDIEVEKTGNAAFVDSFYSVEYYDSIAHEEVPHRVIHTGTVINGQPYSIIIKVSMLDYDNLIKTILLVQIFLMVLLFVGLQILNKKLSKKIWSPFYNTLQSLREFNVKENGKINLSSPDIVEFKDLNNAIEQLTEKSHNAFFSQKAFAENAAHEMQTPLAVLQSKLELLMQTTPLNNEQADLISSMADASQRLNRLNKTLVLLAKIENEQFAGDEEVSVNNVLEETLLQYDDVISQKNIAVQVKSSTVIIHNSNKTLIEILISNLLSNALRHNNKNGLVNIILSDDKLVFQNTGDNKMLDKEMIFQRFNKNSNDINSIGLGLEIVEKICRLQKFSITYSYPDNMHTFSVQF